MDSFQPNYGVYVVFSKKPITSEELKEHLQKVCDDPDAFLVIKKCIDWKNRDVDTQRWHICLKKELIEKVRDSDSEYGLEFRPYRVSRVPPGEGKTYAFFIPYKDEQHLNDIKAVFSALDGRFIREGSYQILTPVPREDGSERKYILVKFSRVNENYPRAYIKTLRALITDLRLSQGEVLSARWCKNTVLRDTEQGLSK